MEDTIALIKAISSFVWPIFVLLIIFMFRKEIRLLLASLLGKKKNEDESVGETLSPTQVPLSTPGDLVDNPYDSKTDENTPVGQFITRACKHINTGKYFVVLSENNEKIYSINPLGEIKWIEKKLFQTIENVSIDLLENEQREAWYQWIQNDVPDKPEPGEPKNPPIIGYLPTYIKLLNNPDIEPSRMLSYIKSKEKVSWFETKEYLHDAYGYELTSGSMGASLKALETLGYVRIDGQGPNKKIIFSMRII